MRAEDDVGVYLTGVVPQWALEQEFDLVEQATFTDPEDQSAWIYHRWLLSQLMARYTAASTSLKVFINRLPRL